MEATELCKVRHQAIDEKLNIAENRLNTHGQRLDKLEQNAVRLEERLDNLIKQLSSLNNTMKWFIDNGRYVGFFFYVIKINYFKRRIGMWKNFWDGLNIRKQ